MPCYQIPMKHGGHAFLCGDLGPHCSSCAGVGDNLCDFPVGDDKTCDLPLCDSHAYEVAPNIHYCPGHLVMWQEHVRAGGVDKALTNVAPFMETAVQAQNEQLKASNKELRDELAELRRKILFHPTRDE